MMLNLSNAPLSMKHVRQVTEFCSHELAKMSSLFSAFRKCFKLQNWYQNVLYLPIYKKGDKTIPGIYRPVSLTSICSKIMEHIIHSNIMRHIDRHNILTDKQHGFRTKHSCESQLLLTTHDLLHSLDNNTQTDIIIMDFSKAFDTVPHNRLLYKLTKYGITGNLHTWISNFLTKRKQRVVVDGEHSDWTNVRSGMPQGTVLGPLLFLLYINDLPHGISSTVRLFADDCVMYHTIKTDSDAQTLQHDLDTLTKWQDNWQMTFNTDKCFTLKVTHSKTPKQHKYRLSNSTLQETSSHTYLGVELSRDLRWTNHVNKTTAKANKVLGFIRRNLHSCTRDLKASAFKALVRPHLEYCSTVWDPHVGDLVDKMESIQRRGARFVYRDYKQTSSVTSMLSNLGWEPLQDRRKIARLTMLQKIRQGQVAIHPASSRRSSSRLNHTQSYIKPTGRSDFYLQSYFPHTINDWNSLLEHIVNINDIQLFKSAVTSYICPSTASSNQQE